MHALRQTGRALATGALAGLAALVLDQLLVLATLGFLVPLAPAYVVAYLALGATLALVVEIGARLLSRPSPGGWEGFGITLALVYAPPIFERVYYALGYRASDAVAVPASAIATAGYGLWILLLRRIAGRAPAIGPLLGAITAAAGLAVNRNLVGHPIEPAALAADGALLAASLGLAYLARRGGTRRALTALGALAVAAAVVSAVSGGGPTPTVDRAPAGSPNLVLIVVDTLRQDVFEAVLEQTEEGRSLRRSLGGSAWFTQSIAASPWTVPSMGSIMTGLYPQEHGFQAGPKKDPGRPLAPLPASIPTLAEHLLARGYWTEAIGTNPLLQPVSGIARGFLHYEILSGPTVKLPPLTALARLGLIKRSYYQQAGSVRRRLDQRLGGIAASGRPVFLWLHLLDPHAPLHAHSGLTPDPAAGDLDRDRRLYRDEVRYALVEVERMLDLLRARGLWDDTVLIFVSDHGEMFPADGHDVGVTKVGGKKPKLYGHGHALYEELVRVPLVIRPPGGLPEDRRLDVLTHHTDLHDTVADLLDLDVPRIGRDRVSLRPWLEREPAAAHPGRAYALIGATQHGPEQRALRTRQLKLIEYLEGGRPAELYRISADPGELSDLADRRPKWLRSAHRQLGRHWSRLSAPPEESRPAALDADTLERLKALGYVP